MRPMLSSHGPTRRVPVTCLEPPLLRGLAKRQLQARQPLPPHRGFWNLPYKALPTWLGDLGARTTSGGPLRGTLPAPRPLPFTVGPHRQPPTWPEAVGARAWFARCCCRPLCPWESSRSSKPSIRPTPHRTSDSSKQGANPPRPPPQERWRRNAERADSSCRSSRLRPGTLGPRSAAATRRCQLQLMPGTRKSRNALTQAEIVIFVRTWTC